MNRPLHLLLIGAIVLGLIAAPVSAASVDPRFEAFVNDPVLEPGQERTLTVQLLNDAEDVGDVAETAENAEVTLLAGDSPVAVKSGSRFVDDIVDGEPLELSFQVAAPPDAASGSYDLRLRIRYEHEGDHETKTIDVPVEIEETARFGDVSVAGELQVGETDQIAITLENNGDAVAHDATVVLESPSAALNFPGGTTETRVFVGRWGPGDTRTLETDLSVASSGTTREYALQATVTYEDASGRQRSKAVVVRLTPAPRQRFEIVDLETRAPVGGSGVLTLSVRNEGPDVAHASTVTLRSTDPDLTFAGGETTAAAYAGEWTPGEVRNLTYRLWVAEGAVVRDYPLEATVQFENGDGDSRTPRSTVGSVRPVPEQTFAIEQLSSTLAVGDEGVIEGTVRNTGATTARNVVVVYIDDNTNIVPIETEFAVGDLGPGEVASFSFDAEVSDSADAGPRQLSLSVRYRDADDDVRRSDPIDAQVQVGTRSDVFSVEPVGATFQSGSSGVLELRVTNEGDEAVSDVSAKLFADDPLSSADDEAFIDELGAGETTTIRFALTAAGDAVERKVYPVSLDFQYDDAEGDTRLSDSYDVPVRVTASQDGGGPSLPLLGGAAAVLVALIGGAVYLRRR